MGAIHLVFLLLAIINADADPVGSCPSTNGDVVDFLPDLNDCSVFYKCNWGTPIRQECPAGLHFNTNLNVCDWPWNVDCRPSITSTTTSSTTTTIPSPSPSPSPPPPGCLNADCPFFPEPPANVTFFPHHTDCSRYCMCDWFGKVHDKHCPKGLHWNSRLDTCDWSWSAGCDDSYTTDNTSTTTTTTTTYPPPTNTSTTTTTTTAQPPLSPLGCRNADCPFFPEPPANVTFFPHDTDCSRYCMCDWFGKVHDKHCPEGLHWNSRLDTCDWSWSAGCDDSYTTANTSTTTTTTTTSPLPTNTSTTTTTTTVQPPPPLGCRNADCPYFPEPPANVTFFPHDTNCSRYCMCDWFRKVHDKHCPAGLHWNSKLDTCDWPWSAGCDESDTTANTSTTTTTTTTSLPPTNTSTTTTTTTAQPPPSPLGCRNANCPFFPKPPAYVTFFPHDTDCSRYCMCDWLGKVHDKHCPEDLHWNSKLDTCDWSWSAGCDESDTTANSSTTTTTTTTSPPPTNTSTTTTTTTAQPPPSPLGCRNANCPFFPERPANVTFFPHDTNCSRYCMCDWFGKAYDKPCSEGLHWNSKLDICDWPWYAGCV